VDLNKNFSEHAQGKNFKREHSKISLKFITKASITLGLVAITLRNFTRRRTARQAW